MDIAAVHLLSGAHTEFTKDPVSAGPGSLAALSSFDKLYVADLFADHGHMVAAVDVFIDRVRTRYPAVSVNISCAPEVRMPVVKAGAQSRKRPLDYSRKGPVSIGVETAGKREVLGINIFRISHNSYIFSLIAFIVTIIFLEHIQGNRQRKLLFHIVILVNIHGHQSLTADKPAVMGLVAGLTFIGMRPIFANIYLKLILNFFCGWIIALQHTVVYAIILVQVS